jgi:hypothetical protein
LLNARDATRVGQRDTKRSADATSALLKNYVVDRLETVIDQGKTVTHAQLAEEIDRVITDEKAMRKQVKLPAEVRPTARRPTPTHTALWLMRHLRHMGLLEGRFNRT